MLLPGLVASRRALVIESVLNSLKLMISSQTNFSKVHDL
jgi:hypothetical protein